LDVDNDGVLTLEEIMNGLNESDLIHQEEIKKIFRSVNAD